MTPHSITGGRTHTHTQGQLFCRYLGYSSPSSGARIDMLSMPCVTDVAVYDPWQSSRGAVAVVLKPRPAMLRRCRGCCCRIAAAVVDCCILDAAAVVDCCILDAAAIAVS